ncbi:MAG: TetR/AcrR family transcriptional regulator [Candidatus Hydrogenedentales bacterium]
MIHAGDGLTPKQREIREREEQILETARQMFFEKGYYNLTMGKIAKRVNCAKGTVYLHFPSKEDIIVALAERAHERRYAMLQRAMGFQGYNRERLLAFCLAGEYYARLNPGDMQIMKTITRSFREKISAERAACFEKLEQRIINYLMRMVHQAVTDGDLVLRPGSTVGRIVWALWALAEGGYGIVLSGVSLEALGIEDPWGMIASFAGKMADSLGWKPLSSEWDYDASIKRIQREVFADEARQLGEFPGDA